MGSIRETLSELYFHELDARERIFNRLQVNLAIYASAFAVLAYMARVVDFGSSCMMLTLFYSSLVGTVPFLLASVAYTWSALTGYKYMVLPKASALVNYGEQLKEQATQINQYNEEYTQNIVVPDPKERLDEYVSEIMSRCIDQNYAINEARRQTIRKALQYLVYSAIPLTVASIIFVAYDLDASSRKVDTSYDSSSPLVRSIGSIANRLDELAFSRITKEEPKMPTENHDTTPQVPRTPPPPPQEPKKPEPQYSTEDFKTPIPDKATLLNEGK